MAKNRLQCRRPGFHPWIGKIHWRRKRLSTPVFWPEELHQLYLWGCKELDMTEWLSLTSQMVRNLPAMQKIWVQSLGQKDPPRKGMATHSSILAWRIPWTEETGGLQSLGPHRIRHNWVTHTHTHTQRNYKLLPLILNHIWKNSAITSLGTIHLLKSGVQTSGSNLSPWVKARYCAHFQWIIWQQL